jgi:hypothetical protein
MMLLLAVLLALNAILHGAIIARFGVKGNEPPLVFGIADLVLAIIVFLAVPYALWAALIVSLVGIAGLTLQFNRIPHDDKTIERVIWALDAVIILLVVYLLFVR